MANEPERPIEKLLRAAAGKRRDAAGGPFELHPATRRLLQGEVARQFAKPRRQRGSLSFLRSHLWSRISWGAAILAILVAAVWLVFPGGRGEKPEALLAKNRTESQAMPAKEPPPPARSVAAVVAPPSEKPPPAKAAQVANGEQEQREPRRAAAQVVSEQKQSAKDTLRPAPASEPITKRLPATVPPLADRKKASEASNAASSGLVAQAPAGAVSGAHEPRYALGGNAAPPGNAPAAPATPAPVAATPVAASPLTIDKSPKVKANDADRLAYAYKSVTEAAPANQLKPPAATIDGFAGAASDALNEDGAIRASQRFAKVTVGAKAKSALFDKAAPARAVLASFQLEQNGSELRIVDGDGSVYRGSLQLEDTVRRSRATRAEAPAVTAAASAPKDVREERPAVRLDAYQVAPQTYSFRVIGTNLSLHKKIVFTGNLVAVAPTGSRSTVTTNLAIAGNFDDLQTRSPKQLSVPLQNSRISGKLVIGNAKAVEINAAPTNP